MKVLYTNPPWYEPPTADRAGWRGVRAGSRWPHTFAVHSFTERDGLVPELASGYLPFPIWLATAAAFASRDGFETLLRDSLSMGETYDSFYAWVCRAAPDVIVLETSTPTVNLDLGIARKLRELLPDVRIVFTGLHFELEQTSFLEAHLEVDFTAFGEYELPVLGLLRALRDGTELSSVPALVYRDQSGVASLGKADVPSGNGLVTLRKTEYGKLDDLAAYPWPLRDTLPNENYFDGVCGLERPQLQLMATRGCPYGCIFCAWPQMLFRSPRYRKRPPKDVVDEIVANLARIPYKSIYIDDDTFNISKAHVLELAQRMKEAGIGGRIPWSTMGRADLMDEEQLVALADAGLFSIKYGVESADQAILNEIDKHQNLEKNLRMIRRTTELGIRVHLTFTFGLPSDTAETIERTIDLACTLPVESVQFSIATPFPGTEMYRLYDEKGWIVSKKWDDYNGSTVAVSRTENFTGAQLEAYVVEAYERFDRAQTERKFDSGQAKDALAQIAARLGRGTPVAVFQSSRVPLTRWIIHTMKAHGADVHVIGAHRFAGEFSAVLPPEKIHTFDGQTHFDLARHAAWAGELQRRYGFAGSIIPYTHDLRAGYEDVERIAMEAGSRLLVGITQTGKVFHFEGMTA